MKRYADGHRLRRGFTLMEMAVVLVIVGLIVTAVISGKGTMDAASSLRAYQKFVIPCVAAASKNILHTGESLGATFIPDEPISLAQHPPLVCDIQGGGVVQIVNADDELKDKMRQSLHNGQDIIVDRANATITLYQPGGT